MIKFFRNIRSNLLAEGKSSRYLKYAIGEIILVVFGILIALSINNWNEKRKDLIKEKATLYKFLQDLESDASYFEDNLKEVLSIDALHKELFLTGFKGKKTINHNNPNHIRRSLVYNPIAKENDPNITNKIDDDKIREEIQIYFRSMSEVFESKTEHENIVLEIREYLRKNKIHNVENWFESEMLTPGTNEISFDIIDITSLIELSQNKDFQQLVLESSIKVNETKSALIKLIEDNTRLISQIKQYIKNND